MKKVAVVVGTRPEAIKMAPVYLELKKSKTLQPLLLSTGQHQQMLEQALGAFGLTPDHDLKLMAPGQQLVDLTARVLTSVYQSLLELQPAAILVQGDTTTVFAASLAAAFADIPIGHVEAGLRTYQMRSPWPEEMNRRLTSPLCRWAFAPTEVSRRNLIQEQIPAENCHVTGNSVIDALLFIRDRLGSSGVIGQDVAARNAISAQFTETFLSADSERRFILVTGHRRESFGEGFENICRALLEIVEKYSDVGVLYPVHLNPNVRKPVDEILRGHPGIELIEPVGYLDFVWLMNRSFFILSDSGGVQEEAPSLGKPVLVMRESTERPEGVDAGTCRLVGTNPQVIIREVAELLGNSEEYSRRAALKNPYGDGQTARRIREILERDLG
ncbi:MAG: UDP-N-acetylglucosamine 2-epimerase (non-hydrolyzing) [Pirellulaceae bacterium]|nr:UDP-N-acetylglucosamine 2-epimerase (non-hydrolyzing) [Pirellulaceae bacterium]